MVCASIYTNGMVKKKRIKKNTIFKQRGIRYEQI